MTDADLADLILYLADISSTLRAFMEVYPSGGQHLEQAGLIERYKNGPGDCSYKF